MGEALLHEAPDVLETRGAYMTSTGRRVPLVDEDGRKLHVTWATGYSVNTSPFRNGSCGEALNKEGFVKADEFQRIIGFERYNMFAAGDCCCEARFEGGERTAIGALRHAGGACANVARIAYQWAVKRKIEGVESSWVPTSDKGNKWCAIPVDKSVEKIRGNLVSLGSKGQLNVFHKSFDFLREAFKGMIPIDTWNTSENGDWIYSCPNEGEGVSWKMGMMEDWLVTYLNGKKPIHAVAEGEDASKKTMDDFALFRNNDYMGIEWKDNESMEEIRGIMTPPPSPKKSAMKKKEGVSESTSEMEKKMWEQGFD